MERQNIDTKTVSVKDLWNLFLQRLWIMAIAAVAVVFSLYAVLWSVVVSLWAGFAALIGGAVGGVLGGSAIAATGFPLPGLALVGAGLVCVGVTVLWFFGCKAATKGAALLTKGIFVGIGRCFGRKERKA